MANGPRKELSFLDRALMNKAATQGGVLNFLGQQPEVTAPVRAQSHADSPPVQLAYITDAEKDLLVKSNIHGSMAGKPNPGPAGIESLDDFFNLPGGGIGGGSTAGSSGSVSSGGSAENYGIQSNQAVTDEGQVLQQQNDGSYKPVSEQQQQAQETVAQQGPQSEESANLQLQNILESQAVDEAKKTKKSGFTFPSFFGLTMDFLTEPTVDFLKSINGLSILNNQVLTTDAERKRYYEEYKDKINEAGYGSLFAFKTALEESPEGGVQGEESQYRLDPASYFDPDLYKELEQKGDLKDYPEFLKKFGLKPLSSRFATTTGGIAKLAQSNIEQYKKFLPDGTANPNYNPDFLKKVFDARADLDRQGINWLTGNKQGEFKSQPEVSSGVPAAPSLPVPPGTPPPDSYPIPGQPPFIIPGPFPFPLPDMGIPGNKFGVPMPYNYYAQSPQYISRGLNSFNTEEFNEQLRNRFGVA